MTGEVRRPLALDAMHMKKKNEAVISGCLFDKNTIQTTNGRCAKAAKSTNPNRLTNPSHPLQKKSSFWLKSRTVKRFLKTATEKNLHRLTSRNHKNFDYRRETALQHEPFKRGKEEQLFLFLEFGG